MSASPTPTVSVPRAGASSASRWWASPGGVVGLWALLTALYLFDHMRFGGCELFLFPSSMLYLSGVPLFAALVAAAITGLHRAVLPVAGKMLFVYVFVEIVQLAGHWLGYNSGEDSGPAGAMFAGLVGFAVIHVFRFGRQRGARFVIAGLAAAAVGLVTGFAPSVPRFDSQLMTLAAPDTREPDAALSIDQERLWTAQPDLVDRALAPVQAPQPGKQNSYLIAVAAGGSQKLFGREARTAQVNLGRALGAERRRLLLANDADSLYHVPLAARTNLDAVLQRLGARIDRSRDLVVLYLASHGGRDAALMTDLPDDSGLNPIDAPYLAAALARAGIKRRVVIVSACFAGSWIKPLANDDTIVIAAARADRTSFGCSDQRDLTYFGEAMLKGPLLAGASLAQTFDAARRQVAAWEGVDKVTPSEPQAFVGRKMRGVWNQKLRSGTR